MKEAYCKTVIDNQRNVGVNQIIHLLDTPRSLITCPRKTSPSSPFCFVSTSTTGSDASSDSSTSTPPEEVQFVVPTSPVPFAVNVNLRVLVTSIRASLKQQCGIDTTQLRLGGGFAGIIVKNDLFGNGKKRRKNSLNPTNDAGGIVNDIDFVFILDESVTENQMHSVRSVTLEIFGNLTGTPGQTLFVNKTVKVWNERERWALISLGGPPFSIDLVFVVKMTRKYLFSIDSFQINIDRLLEGRVEEKVELEAESLYGDIEEAIGHIRNKVIATHAPESIWGGGLLRYCDLLTRGFKSSNGQRYNACMEKLMCTRFFIDFQTLVAQEKEIERYLRTSFVVNDPRKLTMLRLLIRVIQRSSHCIMNHERRLILGIITNLMNLENLPYFVWPTAPPSPFVNQPNFVIADPSADYSTHALLTYAASV